MKHGLCALLFLSAVPALAAENTPAEPSAYQRVMQAQYAAQAAPLPARPDEAQRIYDSYLHSIGQPAKNNSTESGSNAGVTAH
jgi:hypothetical protein